MEREGEIEGNLKVKFKKNGIMAGNRAIKRKFSGRSEQSSLHFLTEKGKGIMMC